MRSRLPGLIALCVVLLALPAFAAHHHFHAQAVAIGGDVPAAAVVALAPAGGAQNATQLHYDADGISFDEAQTSVSGTDDGKVAVTRVSIVLRNVNVLDRLHIDEMGATMTSRQARGASEGEITFDDVHYGRVTFDGAVIDVAVRTERLNMLRTFRALRQRLDSDIDEQTPEVLTTSAVARNARTLVIAGFGTLYFGEVSVKPGDRQITLLRLELEPQYRFHHVTLGDGETNGVEYWP